MTAFASQDQHVLNTVVAIAAAYVLALPLGWHRKAKGAAHVGLRTLPLVSVGTCAYLLVARYLYERGIFDADGQARSLRAMMTGVGFIGGGAILKDATHVKGVGGVTTAATVWTTGAIGASVAHGYYSVAAVLTLTSLFVVDVTGRLTVRRQAADERRDAPATSHPA
jgi:putative Mg2+ transporter-C (MgtC) family protein